MGIKKKTKERKWIDWIEKYRLMISFDPKDKIYIADVVELPGCASHGKTQKEAVANVHEAIEGYLESLVDRNISIPEPLANRQFSGKIHVRITPELHGRLIEESNLTQKSLNSLVEELLASGIRKA